MPTVFLIVGRSQTGKTSLIKKLIPELKRKGFSVAAVKHCSKGFKMDREGKDSWVFMQAGADGVLSVSPERIGLIKQRDQRTESPLQFASAFFGDTDFVLVEGFHKATGINKIEVLRSSVSKELKCQVRELTAVVSDFDTGLDLPKFAHEDVSGIVEFMEGQMDKDTEGRVELKVNGKNVGINRFVQKLLRNVNLAVIETLKMEDKEFEDIEVRIRGR
jgi:molybdopterin-guanine dinucleotide biosynthesis protein B